MLHRINELLKAKADFAFETTLSSKSYVNTVRDAQKAGFSVTLVYFWLDNIDLAIERVQMRVNEGGHNIPIESIKRRYQSGSKIYSVSLYQLLTIGSYLTIQLALQH